jgi:hypothetical protein
MTKIALSIAAAALLAGMAPALAKEDCAGGYKTFMNKIAVYIPKVTGGDLASAVQKGLDAYNSCQAGDSFSPRGVWDQIEADMAAKAKG